MALCGKQIREGKHRKRIYWINQEKLFAPHRLEVLKALDRQGEAIARKAQTVSNSSCHTPALKGFSS